jgi:hypothetical protein
MDFLFVVFYFKRRTWRTCLNASGIVKLAILGNYFPRHTHMQRACSKLAAEVQALARLWNVCLTFPTTAKKNVGAIQMANILDSFLILLSVSVWRLALVPWRRKTREMEGICTARDNKNKKLRGLSPRSNYTNERPPLVGEVNANFFGYRTS